MSMYVADDGGPTPIQHHTVDPAEHDTAGLRSLHRWYGPVLLDSMLARTGGDRQLAEAVVAEAIGRVRRAVGGSSRPSGDLRRLLSVVARKVLIEHRRSGRVPGDPRLPTSAVVQALGKVAPHHRAVIIELYLRRRDRAEAARRLDLSEDTVKDHAYQAIRALRTALEGGGATMS